MQLVESVDLHELNAGCAIDVRLSDFFNQRFHDAVRARIAVRVGLFNQFAGGIEQRVVHPPGIDAKRVELMSMIRCLAQPLFQRLQKGAGVPTQTTRGLHRLIAEAMDFFNSQPTLRKGAEDRTAAGRSKIERQRRG